ncbi:MAG: response regulator [Clostridia bacterium]|nr:response regulator [Clostridia bacterium]
MVQVMIAEDNIELSSMYCRFLTKDKNINIISKTRDGESTVEMYQALKPDVLLLDLDMPKLNGLEVINRISKDSDEKNKCNIIVISGNVELMHRLFNTAKVYRIMPKPTNLDEVLSLIKDISNAPKELDQIKLKSLLLELKFNLYSKGTLFLIDAINIAYNNPVLLCKIEDLYNRVSIKNNVSVNKVQRSIRSSIDVMNNHISHELLRSFFHIYNNEIIAPKYFFTIIIEYLYKEK